jgi:predicted RNA polymerase sigma factor
MAAGDLVPLDEQDRAKWDRGMIDEGTELVKASLAGPRRERAHGQAGG